MPQDRSQAAPEFEPSKFDHIILAVDNDSVHFEGEGRIAVGLAAGFTSAGIMLQGVQELAEIAESDPTQVSEATAEVGEVNDSFIQDLNPDSIRVVGGIGTTALAVILGVAAATGVRNRAKKIYSKMGRLDPNGLEAEIRKRIQIVSPESEDEK